MDDPRVGRFFATDPLEDRYPHNSPYAFSENNVIDHVELEGAERYHYLRFQDRSGNTVLALDRVEDIYERVLSISYKNGKLSFFKTVKNRKKEYYVWQDVGQSDHQLSVTPLVTTQSNSILAEHLEFETLNEAKKVKEKDFNSTEEDFNYALAQTFLNSGMLFKGMIPRGFKSIELHHLIPKRLGKSNSFVRRAIKDGWKINAKINLTPLVKFFTATGKGVHGKHPKYTKQIDDHLNGIPSDFDTSKFGNYLDQLNEYILKKIKENPNTKINDMNLDLKNFKFKG